MCGVMKPDLCSQSSPVLLIQTSQHDNVTRVTEFVRGDTPYRHADWPIHMHTAMLLMRMHRCTVSDSWSMVVQVRIYYFRSNCLENLFFCMIQESCSKFDENPSIDNVTILSTMPDKWMDRQMDIYVTLYSVQYIDRQLFVHTSSVQLNHH